MITAQMIADTFGVPVEWVKKEQAKLRDQLVGRTFDPRYNDPRILESAIKRLEDSDAKLKEIRPLKLKLAASVKTHKALPRATR